jgi:uncharacterized protein (DUF2141 family)
MKSYFKKASYQAIIGILAVISLFSFKPDKENLTLNIKGIKQKGTLHISFCDDKNQWTDNGKYTFQFPVDGSENAKIEINSIPKGTYSIAMFQDINGNGKHDTNFLGIPKEPYAFSNIEGFILSTPSFEKCKFQFIEKNQQVTIQILN